jgi:hypothetical protein
LIGIAQKDRPLSTYICGNPGNGKSSLIQRMVLHDIKSGEGVCVIDPTADLINTLIHHIPESRLGDVIYFDTSMPIAIDFFSYQDESERKNLIDDILAIFDLENAPRAKPLLYKIVSTLFDANENPEIAKDGKQCTFLDINHFCQSETRRNKILSYCSEERRESWARVPSPFDFEPITFRMIPFLESKTLRAIIGCKEPKVNLWDVMQKKQILLVNLEDTATDLFIGALLVSRIQHAAFRRRSIPEPLRTPYYLYIDECHTVLKFAVEDFEKILTRARKYKLCLTMANPIPEDLPEKILNKIGTIGNLVLFNLDAANARIFKSRIAPHAVDDLVSLPKFHALFRTNNKTVAIKTPVFLPPRTSPHVESIKARTLRDYVCKPDPKPHNADSGKPEPEGTVLPHEKQTAGRPGARGIFRPPEPRPRRDVTRKEPQRERHPNDKPDP